MSTMSSILHHPSDPDLFGSDDDSDPPPSRHLPPHSPFSHHNSGPTSDRLRNALHRISLSPTSDAEAWSALMNEARSCLRLLSPMDPRADWIESCHISLLHHFSSATLHIVSLAEMYCRWMATDREAACEEDFHGSWYGMTAETRPSWNEGYRVKLASLFETHLGIGMEDNGELTDVMSATTMEGAAVAMGGRIRSAELWIIYIRMKTWEAFAEGARNFTLPNPPPGYAPGMAVGSVLMRQYEENWKEAYSKRVEGIREGVCRAFEVALDHGAGFANNNHLIWRKYANFVRGWTAEDSGVPMDAAHQHSALQKRLIKLRSIYQRGVTHPMLGLDQFWQEYEALERTHSEALASVLLAEWLPKYQHARSVYLERNRVWNITELRADRLATPPVGYEGISAGARGGGAVGGQVANPVTVMEDDFDGDTGGAAGAAATKLSDSEYVTLMEEEEAILSKWRRRAAYERTNPERLNSSELAARVRASYSEEACAFARHPEVWYEWSQWELLHGNSLAGAVSGSTTTAGSAGVSSATIAPTTTGHSKDGGNVVCAVAVLTLGLESLPDSAFLAQAQAEILERHLETNGEENHNGNSNRCIAVMEKFVSRSPTTLGFVLLQRLVRRYEGIAAARAVFARARRILRVREEDETKDVDDVAVDGKSDSGKEAALKMVTTRLKPTVGNVVDTKSNDGLSNAGFITWHLYEAHATIEHRLGQNPHVAARIYELGLRKHRSFLSTPPYVLHYANLLLELNDDANLRSLLMRAVAACEEDDALMYVPTGEVDAAAVARRREIQRSLWDMMLKFESILSSSSASENAAADISLIESRRRKALYGPGSEDVVLGREGPPDEEDSGLGIQKSSLNEQLIRVEGYDVASRIASGMARMVDALTVTGAIGGGEFDHSNLDFAAAASSSIAAGGSGSNIWGDSCAGGASDVSYVRRLRFRREGRRSATAGHGTQVIAGAKLLSKERVSGAGLGMVVAVQNAPEWLRPLLVLLPPIPKFGRGLQKPPPHLIEMALSAMRANSLPSRPVGEGSNGASAGKKRGWAENNEDSSDGEDEDDGGGYSNQFRARQRARLVANSSGS